ncbi:MAG: PAS domain-containing protein [Planctomycetes bacterium]|nr:PAS domain-containing protein [Planctomycetota bacterium]
MSTTRPLDWLPTWISRVGFACWVSDPEGRIAHWNERAAALLGTPVADALGAPCHRLVRGSDAAGWEVCRPGCRVAQLARAGASIEALTLRTRTEDGAERWILLAAIPLSAPDGSAPWIVHCAHDVNRSQRMRGYLARIAARSGVAETRPGISLLSPREREVLGLLALDEDAKSVARTLHISYATVRNHIQHILTKLAAHSLQEAIARQLLDAE